MTEVKPITGADPLSIAGRLVLHARAGKGFMDRYQAIDPRWKELIEVRHEPEVEMPFIADLSTGSAGRFKGEHTYGEGYFGKFHVKVYPFSSGKKIKLKDLVFNEMQNLAKMNESVGRELADLIRRFVFNCYACGDQIPCLDVVDDQCVYDTTHSDGSQINLLNSAFSEAALEAAITALATLKDPSGKRSIGSKANYILLNQAREVAANKLLVPGQVMMQAMSKDATAPEVRTIQNVNFGSLQPIYDTEIHADQFILVNSQGSVKPFIMNLPVISERNGRDEFDTSVITTFKDEDHELWKVKGLFFCGWAATEGWMYTVGSGSSFGTLIDADTAPGDI